VIRLEELLATKRWLVRRFECRDVGDDAIVRVHELLETTSSEVDDIAHVFFVLSGHARALQALWQVMPDVLAQNFAQARGRHVPRAELRALRFEIASRRASAEDVRAWFAAKLA
jgi:hypothetical protein